MGSLSKRRCARGEQCTKYALLGEPHPVRSTSESQICEPCQRAEGDADFETHQRRLNTYPHLQELKAFKDNPEKKRLLALKREFVAQMLGKPGAFRERVEEIRGYWQIDDPPVQIPRKSEDILLLPPNIKESEDLSSLHAAAAHHPRLSPPGAILPRPDCLDSVRSNLILQWEVDLRSILLDGGVSEGYLTECRGTPIEHPLGGRPIPQEHLPWYRFAAACVRYNVPLEEAPSFADYGGLPGQPSEPILRAWSGRELREREMESRIWDEQEKFIIRKIFEKHSLDYYSEMRDVMNRFLVEIEEEIPKRIREEHELDMEYSPPRHYHIEYIPGKHTDKDLKNTRAEIEKQVGVDTSRGPKLETPKDNLKSVWCAILAAQGWSIHSISGSLDRSIKTVEIEVEEGNKLLNPGD